MNDTASQEETGSGDVPSFLIKSSLGCSIVAVVLLAPFTAAHFYYGRTALGASTALITAALVMNIIIGLQGQYSPRMNSYLVAPAGLFAAWYTMEEFGAAGSYWPFLLILCFYFMLPERRALLFNLAILIVTIPTAWLLLESDYAVRFSASMLGVSLFSFISVREMNSLHRMLREQAVTDTLTGLYNRTLLGISLRQAIAQHRRSGLPMTLIAIDIDDFKEINDSLGHDAGDRALEGLGRVLQRRIRAGDMAFRVGGEEFNIMLHNTGARDGARVAEDIRAQVERESLVPQRRITLSLGVCELEEDMGESDWLKAGDKKLYQAKAEGRNRVVA